MVSTLCSKCPSVAIEFSDQMCPAVLHLLDETEPAPIASLWRAVLRIVVTVLVCLLFLLVISWIILLCLSNFWITRALSDLASTN